MYIFGRYFLLLSTVHSKKNTKYGYGLLWLPLDTTTTPTIVFAPFTVHRSVPSLNLDYWAYAHISLAILHITHLSLDLLGYITPVPTSLGAITLAHCTCPTGTTSCVHSSFVSVFSYRHVIYSST